MQTIHHSLGSLAFNHPDFSRYRVILDGILNSTLHEIQNHFGHGSSQALQANTLLWHVVPGAFPSGDTSSFVTAMNYTLRSFQTIAANLMS